MTRYLKCLFVIHKKTKSKTRMYIQYSHVTIRLRVTIYNLVKCTGYVLLYREYPHKWEISVTNIVN